MRASTIFPRAAMVAAALVAGSAALATPIAGWDTTAPYICYYGSWDAGRIFQVRTGYKFVILEPSSNVTPAIIQTIRGGVDNTVGTADDVMIFGYISIGEDARPGAPVAGTTGPRVDPRPAISTPLSYISANNAWDGTASAGGTAYASYYLDDENGNGTPDQNTTFGGYYVNAGDPAWYTVLKTMRRSVDGLSGLDEILTTTYGDGLGCDGVFFDTLDTAAPNSFGATKYEWTTPGMQRLIQQIRSDYASAKLIANRGVFFFDPSYQAYRYPYAGSVDAVMYESYFTDSDEAHTVTPSFDYNKFVLAPKINAEAGRPNGFTAIALGYDHTAPLPQPIRDQDFLESQNTQGWPLYRTLRDLSSINSDAATWNAANPDTTAPVWDSTAATSPDSDGATAGNQPPAARVGVQEAEARNGSVTVRWDVARDQTYPLAYNIYYTSDAVLNFATATKLAGVVPQKPTDYTLGVGAGRYPYEYTVTGLTNGTSYRFAVRVQDALGHEETNAQELMAKPRPDSGNVQTITIDGDMTDWAGVPAVMEDVAGDAGAALADVRRLYIAQDADYIYMRIEVAAAPNFLANYQNNIFVDTDDNLNTGYVSPAGNGSELLIQGGSGYDQRGGGFNEGTVPSLATTQAVSVDGRDVEFRIARNATYPAGNPAGAGNVFTGPTINIALTSDTVGNVTSEIAPPGGYTYSLAAPSVANDWRILGD